MAQWKRRTGTSQTLIATEMARKILTHVVEKYPGHYIAQEAKRYLQGMP